MRGGPAEGDTPQEQKDPRDLTDVAPGRVARRCDQVVAPLLAEATRAAYLAKTPVR